MSYAQKDYLQTLGNNGKFTIAESGCLLVAFANLLERSGNPVAPDMLNSCFMEDGVYLQGATEGTRDSLTWASITAYDNTISVSDSGIGVPTSNDSVVEMTYPSKLTGSDATTYALVADAAAGTIVDSYDGVIKSWDIYGGPKKWVAYSTFPAIVITPLKAPETPAVAAQDSVPASPDSYQVLVQLNGYGSSRDAVARQNAIGIIVPGNYYIFNQITGMLNVTKELKVLGLWINPEDNVRDTTVPEVTPAVGTDTSVPTKDQPEEDTHVPVKVIPPSPLKWQQSYVAGLGPIQCKSINSTVVHDLAGEFPDQQLEAGMLVEVAGKFEKDGAIYFRTVKSVQENKWYGIPRTNLARSDSDVDDELDRMLNSNDSELKHELGVDELTGHEKLIKAGATVEGKVEKIGKLLSFRKK